VDAPRLPAQVTHLAPFVGMVLEELEHPLGDVNLVFEHPLMRSSGWPVGKKGDGLFDGSFELVRFETSKEAIGDLVGVHVADHRPDDDSWRAEHGGLGNHGSGITNYEVGMG